MAAPATLELCTVAVVPVGLGRPRDYSQEEFPDAAAVGVEVNALPLLSSFLLILLAELPDKTLYTVLLLATRNRPWPVLFGAWRPFSHTVSSPSAWPTS